MAEGASGSEQQIEHMEIEFSPSQLPLSQRSEPALRAGTVSGALTGAASLPGVEDWQSRLNALPLSRPGTVAEVQARASLLGYPPPELVDRIAALLAIKMQTGA